MNFFYKYLAIIITPAIWNLNVLLLRSRLCRPVFKEFDEWPTISLEPDPPRDKRNKDESLENFTNNNLIRKTPQK